MFKFQSVIKLIVYCQQLQKMSSLPPPKKQLKVKS